MLLLLFSASAPEQKMQRCGLLRERHGFLKDPCVARPATAASSENAHEDNSIGKPFEEVEKVQYCRVRHRAGGRRAIL